VIEQRTHMSQNPAQSGVVAARAAGRVRMAPNGAPVAFCTSVLTTTDADGIPTPHRRPPIE
jgi:hypothetical protein